MNSVHIYRDYRVIAKHFKKKSSGGGEGKQSPGGEEKDMKDTTHDSVESGDPHEWSVEEVDTFLRSLGTAQSYLEGLLS